MNKRPVGADATLQLPPLPTPAERASLTLAQIYTNWEPNARQAAKKRGEPFYWGFKPCLHGHRPLRYTKNGQCVTCSDKNRQARRAVKQVTPSPRQLAIEQGVHFYSTGKPCARGHTAVRYTTTGHCTLCKGVK